MSETKANVIQFCCQLIGIPYAGWVASMMWAWFIVPLGAPAIGIWHAAGIILCMMWGPLMITVRLSDLRAKKDPVADTVKVAVSALAVPTVLLGLSALYHWLG